MIVLPGALLLTALAADVHADRRLWLARRLGLAAASEDPCLDLAARLHPPPSWLYRAEDLALDGAVAVIHVEAEAWPGMPLGGRGAGAMEARAARIGIFLEADAGSCRTLAWVVRVPAGRIDLGTPDVQGWCTVDRGAVDLSGLDVARAVRALLGAGGQVDTESASLVRGPKGPKIVLRRQVDGRLDILPEAWARLSVHAMRTTLQDARAGFPLVDYGRLPC